MLFMWYSPVSELAIWRHWLVTRMNASTMRRDPPRPSQVERLSAPQPSAMTGSIDVTSLHLLPGSPLDRRRRESSLDT
jgi:hypothetical protein